MALCRMVAIGASAGGVKAVQVFFGSLPTEPMPVAYVVILHMSKSNSVDYKMLYGDQFQGDIVEIFDKMEIRPGNAYFAPAGYHVLIENEGYFSLTQDEPVNFARPSIDVTFSSVAQALGRRSCGVLMTGSNEDGARGLKEMSELGSFTLVQDPKLCEYSTMPAAAIERFKPDAILSVSGIAAKVVTWARDF